MYEPVFGLAAKYIFLFGSFAVLYSTFFVASAGNARMLADGLRVFRCGAKDEADVALVDAGAMRCDSRRGVDDLFSESQAGYGWS